MGLLGNFKEIIKSIEETPSNFKLAIGPVLLITPIWYVTLYLFPTEFINTNSVYVAICVTYSFAIVSHFFSMTFCNVVYVGIQGNHEKEKDKITLIVVPALFNTGLLVAYTYAAYVKHDSYYQFIQHLTYAYISLFLIAAPLSMFFSIISATINRYSLREETILRSGFIKGYDSNGFYYLREKEILIPRKKVVKYIVWVNNNNKQYYSWKEFCKDYKTMAGIDIQTISLEGNG